MKRGIAGQLETAPTNPQQPQRHGDGADVLTQFDRVMVDIVRDAGRFWGRVDKSSINGCWLWRGARGHAYGRFYLDCRQRPFVHVYAHRYSWMAANSRAIPSGMHVCHACDTPLCVNPAHLFLGSAADNQLDAGRKGRKSGPRIGKLSAAARTELARLLSGRELSQRAIASHLGVTYQTVQFHARKTRNSAHV